MTSRTTSLYKIFLLPIVSTCKRQYVNSPFLIYLFSYVYYEKIVLDRELTCQPLILLILDKKFQ